MLLNPTAPATQKTEQILQIAQQKLLRADTPLCLRLVSFLRLSCSTLKEPGTYSKVLRTLSTQDPTWWATCQVTEAGWIKSSDPQIARLLAPILALHQPQDMPLAA